VTGPLTTEIVRDRLIEALGVDLIGPRNDHRFASELLRAQQPQQRKPQQRTPTL